MMRASCKSCPSILLCLLEVEILIFLSVLQLLIVFSFLFMNDLKLLIGVIRVDVVLCVLLFTLKARIAFVLYCRILEGSFILLFESLVRSKARTCRID